MRAWQISIAALMGVTTVSMIFLFSDRTWLIVLTAGIAAIYLMSYFVTRNLPSGITAMMEANTIRLDGSTSQRRFDIEKRSASKLRHGLFVIFLIALFPTVFLLWIVNTEVIPLSIGFNSVKEMAVSTDGSNGTLRLQEAAFDSWKSKVKLSPDSETHKKLLKTYWPAIVAAAIAWLMFCAVCVRSAYFQMLKDLKDSVQRRAEGYKHIDRAKYFELSASTELTNSQMS
jgi:hypothetical protein